MLPYHRSGRRERTRRVLTIPSSVYTRASTGRTVASNEALPPGSETVRTALSSTIGSTSVTFMSSIVLLRCVRSYVRSSRVYSSRFGDRRGSGSHGLPRKCTGRSSVFCSRYRLRRRNSKEDRRITTEPRLFPSRAPPTRSISEEASAPARDLALSPRRVTSWPSYQSVRTEGR